jgi:hypothetical protein
LTSSASDIDGASAATWMANTAIQHASVRDVRWKRMSIVSIVAVHEIRNLRTGWGGTRHGPRVDLRLGGDSAVGVTDLFELHMRAKCHRPIFAAFLADPV